VLARLATWARRAGLFTEVEVIHLSSDSRLRPDIVITHGSTMLIVDVTIVDPLNTTNLARAGIRVRNDQLNSSSESVNSNDNMAATRYAEGEKSRKYKRRIDENRAKLLTAAVESTGGFGKQFREFLTFVSLVAQEEECGWEAGEISNGIRCAAAVAIQVGNARIVTESRNSIARRRLEGIRREERVRNGAAVAA